MNTVDLSRYDNSWYDPGRSAALRALWMVFGLPVLSSQFPLPSRLRVAVLRAFGARIGTGVVIKPGVAVKYPWHLIVGENCWIGERAWIDNLTTVHLEHSVCISQEAYLCTGNHDWTDPRFGLLIAPIYLGAGSWAGARATLLPGTVLGRSAIASAGSVVSGHIAPGAIVAGNPAQPVRTRTLREEAPEVGRAAGSAPTVHLQEEHSASPPAPERVIAYRVQS